jgi:maleate isomerase
MKLDFETDGGIGNRANLGVIVLETDETLEWEFARMIAHEDVALYHSRIPMVAEIQPDTLARMETDLPAATRLLPPTLDFDVIGYGCTSAATVIGSDRVAARVQQVFPRARVTDPLAAIIAATRSLGAVRIGFLTPYVPEVSQRMRQKLQDAGLEIASFGSFEESNDHTVARITEASIAQAVRAVANAAASDGSCDAVVISCTNLRCLQIIPEIEAEIGVPVLSSNTALAWHMQRLAGIAEKQPQLGRLFCSPLCPKMTP